MRIDSFGGVRDDDGGGEGKSKDDFRPRWLPREGEGVRVRLPVTGSSAEVEAEGSAEVEGTGDATGAGVVTSSSCRGTSGSVIDGTGFGEGMDRNESLEKRRRRRGVRGGAGGAGVEVRIGGGTSDIRLSIDGKYMVLKRRKETYGKR